MTARLDAAAPTLDGAVAACAAHVLEGLDPLVDAIVSGYVAQLGTVATPDVGRRTRAILTLLLEATRDGRSLTATDLRPLVSVDPAGLDIETVLDNYRIAGAQVWRCFMQAAVGHGQDVVAELSLRWMGTVDVLTSCAARAHVDAGQERVRALDARRRELVEAVLSAPDADVEEIGVRFSTVLHPAYTPLLVIGEDAVAQIDRVIAACPPGTLGGHRDAGGVRDRILLLIPGEVDVALFNTADHGQTLIVRGVCCTAGPALLRGVQAVDATARAGLAAGRRIGRLGPDDLLVPRLLASDPQLAGRLRRQLDTLLGKDSGGLLVATLRTYLDNGSIPETARAHDVHPNTVAYRLGRVQTLTGLDPRVPAQCVPLVLGLTLTGTSA